MKRSVESSKASLFDGADNMFGSLSESIRKRLLRLINEPSQESWDDAHCIILSWQGHCACPKKCNTVWQAIIAVDPSFPRVGPREDYDGRCEPWPRIPDSLTIVRAIKHATGLERGD